MKHLLGGVIVVLPAWLAVLLVLKALEQLQGFVKPVSSHLPHGVAHPSVIAILVLIALCFLVGALIQTAIGRKAERAAEQAVLEKIPGYTVLRSLASRLSDHAEAASFQPALVEIEEALVPGFIVERHSGNHSTVFIPSVPTPMAGAVYIMDNNRVHPPESVSCLSDAVHLEVGRRQQQTCCRLRRRTRPSYFASETDKPAANNRRKRMKTKLTLAAFLILTLVASTANSFAQAKKPNILVIWGDDIGWYNPSIYHRGDMGYWTPNIDRIGKEGAMFTCWYGQQSCTAGRAAFITGQSPIRTGLTKVGLPGADIGLSAKDPTIAELLKPLGYATGQFGKNHLGDKDEFLPTKHGFDEFFGNLYHLNAEEEPENPDYPKDPNFKKKFGPRGVIHSYADGRIEDTGPLTRKRMETVDEEFLAGALDFIDRQNKADKPFFVWFNSTRMHIFTHLKAESQGKTGLGLYPDGMVEHDGMVGQLLKKLDDLGIADNTIVVYGTDNGAEVFTWPDGGTTPYRGEKATGFEGAFRTPCLIRWPGVIKPGTVYSDFFAHEDFLPTFCAAAGDSDIVAKCAKGYSTGGKTFKVHLDGYNLMPFLKGEAKESPRKEFLYWSDDGDLMAIRYEQWKAAFLEQHAEANPKTPLSVWQGQFTKLRAPNLYNLRADPFERGPTSIYYGDFVAKHVFIQVPMQAFAAQWLASFKEFPPRQKPASFNLDEVMKKMSESQAGGNN